MIGLARTGTDGAERTPSGFQAGQRSRLAGPVGLSHSLLNFTQDSCQKAITGDNGTMKSRVLLLTVIIVAGFYYIISQPASSLARSASSVCRLSGGWSGPITAHSAPGFTSDEENNIEIYKTARLATVNITSTVLRETWFFQVYPPRHRLGFHPQ